MARQRQLHRAPIREALIDFQIEASIQSLDPINRLSDALAGQASRVGDIWQGQLGVELGQGAVASPQFASAIVGKRFDFDDSHHVVQFRTGGMTFSRLPPYQDWAHMRERAAHFWRMYSQATRPNAIVRLAVRYINEIRVPVPVTDFAEYLTAAPSVPPSLPQSVSGFMQKVNIIDRASSMIAGVVQAIDGSQATPEEIPILLDIEVYQELKLRGQDMEAAWGHLDAMRDFKNRIFFEHIQERTAGMYE